MEWLAQRLDRAFAVRGAISVDDRKTRKHPLYKLEFAKIASRLLLNLLYSDATCPRLKRKHDVWLRFRQDESTVATGPRRQRSTKSVPEEGVEPSRALQPKGF